MQQQYTGVGETFTFQEIDLKGVQKQVITGYISTKSIDKFNDLITDECLDDMLIQIKSGNIKMDLEHETIHENNLNINPIARIVDAKKDEKGIWVKAELNQSNPRFQEIWGSIKDGFLDAFSIAFKPLETAARYIQGKAVRILNKLKLINIGITGTPVNEECRMDKVVIKAIKDLEEDDGGWEKFDDLNDEELEIKHKYIKRTGSPGHYKYFYRDGSSSKSPKGNPYKEGSQAYKDFEKGQETSKKIDSAKTRKDKMKAYLQGTYTKDSMESVANNYGKKFDELSEEELEDIFKEHGENEALKEFGSKEKQQSPEKPNKKKLIQALTDNNTIKNSESMMPEINQSGTSKKIIFSIDKEDKKKFSSEKLEKAQKLVDALNEADISEEDISQYDDDNIKEEKQKESNEDKLKKEAKEEAYEMGVEEYLDGKTSVGELARSLYNNSKLQKNYNISEDQAKKIAREVISDEEGYKEREHKRELFKESADKRDQGPKSPEERRSLDSQIRDRIATLNENKKKQIKEHESNIAHAKEKLSNLKNPENPSEEKEKKYWEGRLRDFESQRDATESHYDEKIENTKEAKEIKKDEGDKEESGKDKGEQFKETTKKREEGKETTSEKTKEKFYGSITRGDIDLNEAAQSMGIGSDIKDPDKKRVKIKEKLDSMSVDRFKQLLKYHGWAKEAKELEQKSTSYSTEESEDNNTMAEENENKPIEQEQEANNEQTETENDEKSEVETLKEELAEVKAQLVEVQKQLVKPEFKALQEAKPITTKLGETVTPLGLIG